MLIVLQPRMPTFRTLSLHAERAIVCYLLSGNSDLFVQTMEEYTCLRCQLVLANLYSATTYYKISQRHFTITEKNYANKSKQKLKIRRVCRCFLKAANDVDEFIVCCRLLHACGPAKTRAHLPNSVRGFGTTRLPADEERSRFLAATAVTGIHSSARYDSARLCRALYTVRHGLNSIHCGTWSQWRSCRASYMWSYF